MPAEEAKSFGVEFMSLEEMWPIADYVTVHVPLIPPTKGNNCCSCQWTYSLIYFQMYFFPKNWTINPTQKFYWKCKFDLVIEISRTAFF